MERIVYSGQLPESFFKVTERVYRQHDFKLTENADVISNLFAMEQARNEIIIYTDHQDIRLVGIFPLDDAIAYFGFWETTNHSDLNFEAFELFEKDAREKQRKAIVGPINFNTYHQYRLSVGAQPSWNYFDREPINPSYYPSLLEKSAFKPKMTFESRMIKKEHVQDVYIDKEILLSEISKIPFNFIPLNPANWIKYEKQIFKLIEAVFNENPFYKSISFEQFKLYYNESFAKKLCPHSSVIFQDKETGELASLSICHPNYACSKIEKPEFIRDFQNLKQKILLVKTVGVHPNYRKRGLMNFMGAYGMLSFQNHYTEVIFCLMRSDNHSLHFTDNTKYEVANYALYEKELFK